MRVFTLDVKQMCEKEQFCLYMWDLFDFYERTLDGIYDRLSEWKEDVRFLVRESDLYVIAENAYALRVFGMLLDVIGANPHLHVELVV